MFQRAKYKSGAEVDWVKLKDPVGSIKYDGAHFFMTVENDGGLRFYSRRQSVKGHFPERTAQLPHLAEKKLPELAGNVYSVELIHTGHNKEHKESHPAISGILNSLPERAIETQKNSGPVRAVLLDVIQGPSTETYAQKMQHLKDVETKFGNPDLVFTPKLYHGIPEIVRLIDKTKRQGREGVIIASASEAEAKANRIKIKHLDTYNLRVNKIVQEVDIKGNPKQSVGALELVDATGRIVGLVGTGFTREMRESWWKNPTSILHRLIQVKTMGFIPGGRLRAPVYNGDADGELDTVA